MKPFRLLDLFSGLGAFGLGLEQSQAFETVALCEIDPHARQILAAKWPGVPIYDDVRDITAGGLRDAGIEVDAICAGFPCQDASVANVSGAGAAGERTGLYVEAIRIARDLDALLLMENVPGLFRRGFGDVLGALAQSGFSAEWRCISARDAGADHERERVWIVAYPERSRWERPLANYSVLGAAQAALPEYGNAAFDAWRALVGGEQPLRIEHGSAVGMERRRLHKVGNAVVPAIPRAIGRAIAQAEGMTA